MRKQDGGSESSPGRRWPEWLATTDHIGSHYPYYYEDIPDEYNLSFEEIVKRVPRTERELDITAVAEVLIRGYPLGDRTLIKGVKKVPWMAKPGNGEWCRHEIPHHDTRTPDTEKIVSKLLSYLRQEVLEYASEAKEIGILLSGGMDSRIVAGVVRQLQQSGELIGSVTALTWGIDESRDVKYAKEIASRFNWSIKHYGITPQVLLENVYVMGEIGAEGAPYHLHALPKIRDESGLDVILSGSYGNSIGRGLYEGDRVLNLNPIVPSWINSFGLLRENALQEAWSSIVDDAYSYRRSVERGGEYQYREIEYQRHYMRRGLQAWMSYVSEKIPIFQLFTSPSIVNMMWGLDPKVRDDRYYKKMISLLPQKIGHIPYAKTGLPFGVDSGAPDDGYKHHHKYGEWMRNDLRYDITNLVKSDQILRMSIFNKRAIDRMLNIWLRADTLTKNKIDRAISWMASLSVMINKYDVEADGFSYNIKDEVNPIVGSLYAEVYRIARGFLRK